MSVDYRSRLTVIEDALRGYSRAKTRTTRAEAIEAALQKWELERPLRPAMPAAE